MLRLRRRPPGTAEFGVVGRARRPGAPGPLAGREAVRLDQVHGATLREAREPGLLPACDAVVGRRPGLLLTVRVADCLPVLLAAPGGAALVHAGWRGMVAGVVEAGVRALAPAEEVFAALGPAIGPCCFEVGPEVAERFPAAAVAPGPRGRPHVDLFAAARLRLLAAGVAAERISDPAPCTRCHRHLLHSHRGSGGAPGRNVAYAVPAGGGGRPVHRPDR